MPPSLRSTLPVALLSSDYILSLPQHALQLCLLCLMFYRPLVRMSRSVLANLHVETLHLRLCPYAIPPDIPVCAIPCQSLTNVSILSTSIIANILGDPSFHVDDHSNIWPLFSLFSSYPVIFPPSAPSATYTYIKS